MSTQSYLPTGNLLRYPETDKGGLVVKVADLERNRQRFRAASPVGFDVPVEISPGNVDRTREVVIGDLLNREGKVDEDTIRKCIGGRFFVPWIDSILNGQWTFADIADWLNHTITRVPGCCVFYRKSIIFGYKLRHNPRLAFDCLYMRDTPLPWVRLNEVLEASLDKDDFCREYDNSMVSFFVSDLQFVDDGLIQPMRVQTATAKRYLVAVNTESANRTNWIAQTRQVLGDDNRCIDVWYHNDRHVLFPHVNLAFSTSYINVRFRDGMHCVNHLVMDYLVSLMARIRAIYHGAVVHNDLAISSACFAPKPARKVAMAIAMHKQGADAQAYSDIELLWYYGLCLTYEPALSNISSPGQNGIGWRQTMTDARLWPFLLHNAYALLGDKNHILYDVLPWGRRHPDAPKLNWIYCGTGITAPESAKLVTGAQTSDMPTDGQVKAVANCFHGVKLVEIAKLHETVERVQQLRVDRRYARYSGCNIDGGWVFRNQFTEIVQEALHME
jgi:hypothetical protein